MKIRIRDIAIKAGVSPATVSNAINGRGGVSDEIAVQIRHLANQMGYRATKPAGERAFVRLVMVKRHGLVVMDTQFFMELMESIERECHAQSLNLLITHIHIGKDKDYRERIRGICEQKCTGVIVMATEMNKDDLELFRNCVSPLIMLDNLFRHESVNSLVMNNYDAGYKATYALHAAGHRHIEHITSTVDFNNMRYRRKGYEAAMMELDLCFSKDSFWHVTPTLDGAYHDMLTLLCEGRVPPTAFFAGNDIIAVGCMKALQEKGYRIPQDVSVIGMDDVPMCQFCSPMLTTIKVFRTDMGSAAVRMLLELANPHSLGFTMKVELSVVLVERDSVYAPSDRKN